MNAAARSTLTREGRDTLWLLGVLALSILPHAARLPWWCSVGTFAALLWRARVAWRDDALPPRWVLVVCLVISLGLTMWTFRTLLGREAGVTLVTLLAALKTLELRARRDAFVITSLGFFLILTQFLYSQSLPMAALMLIVLVGLLTSLVLAQRPMGRPPIMAAAKAALRSAVMGVPVMLALFILFPRLGPLWSLPADAGKRTGLSDTIRLGHVAELAQDDSVAMRLKFPQGPPPARDMYFRGPVLDFFDGHTWHATGALRGQLGNSQDAPPERADARGEALFYQVTLEPSRLAVVPLLEGTLEAVPTPPATSPQLRRFGLDWVANERLTERTQIDGTYWHGVQHGPTERSGLRHSWLQLPRGHNPRSLAWAAAFKADKGLAQADGMAISQALLQHIRTGGYSYTLAPDEAEDIDTSRGAPRPPANLIDRFWLDRKTGFCEHFATAYVFLMRAMGVPSRVVTGYQGVELNPVDGLFVVRNSDAHAWAEIWLPGQGWQRVDPTAMVAPDRVERARQVFRHGNPFPGPLSNIDPAVWGRVRSYIDAGNHRWNVWVLQYSRARQMDMLKNWGFASPDWVDLLRLAGGMLLIISVLGMAWLWWMRPRTQATPWQRPMQRVHQALQASGFPAPSDSPAPAAAMSWARTLGGGTGHGGLDALQAQLREALVQLDALRYAPTGLDKAGTQRERQLLVGRIEQLCQQWRAARRRDRAN